MVAIPIIPDESSLVSWATMVIFAQLLLDTSLVIGDYQRALAEAPYWNEPRRLQQGRKAVRNAALEAVLFMLTITAISAVAVTHATRGIDSRMVLILEGLSRLEAAALLFYMSSKTPRWIGVYYSPKQAHERVEQVSQGLKALRFHVRWSLGISLSIGYCLLLPYCGRPFSAIVGVIFGFAVAGVVSNARRRPAGQDAWIALGTALFLGILSAILFANGCSYVQRVWATGPWRNEWGLRLVSFAIWMALIFLDHLVMWRETEKKMLAERRFSTHDRKARMAISLIFSAVLKSPTKEQGPVSTLDEIQEEDEDDSGEEQGSKETTSDKQPAGSEEETTWSLVKMRLSTNTVEIGALDRAHWAFWIVVSALSLFIVVVNIGATAQMNVVKLNFHDVHEAIYGRMDDGPVCAFDRVGGAIQTFDSQKAAHAARYKIAHCGACSHCSEWHNLRLQYTTRNYLAKATARCGRKSLISGREGVLSCLHEEPIGFQGKCAECWTEDIFCARNYCAFIFLQSTLINTMGNFEVGENVITSATCEEAMCELEFVPCSGANRRRMSITSTIKRPGRQLCNIVDVDWEEIFGNDGAFYSSPVADKSKEEL